MKQKLFVYIMISAFIVGLLAAAFSYVSPVFNGQNTTYGNDIDIKKLRQQARVAYYNGNFEKSKDLYRQIIQYDNDNIDVQKNLIIIYKELGQLNKVKDLYQDLLKTHPDKLKWQYELGLTYYQIGKPEQALQLLLNVYNLIDNQNNEKTDNNNNIKTLTPDEYKLLYYYIGRCLQLVGDYEEALKFYNIGIERNPSFTPGYMGKAEIYAETGDIEKSNLAYKKALSFDSSLSLIYAELAQNYEKLNQPAETYRYWQRSLKTGNKTELAEKKLEHLEEKYPDLKKEEEEKKKKKRADISWIEIEPIKNIEDIPELRIGLLRKINNITMQTGGPFIIKNGNNGKELLKGEARTEWEIKYENRSFLLYKENNLIREIKRDIPLIFELEDRKSTFVMYNVSYGEGYFWAGTEDRQYRGTVELMPLADNKFNVINIIDLESYLLSVVPSEMPAWWPEEALKAQSVAARSYALNNRNSRHQHEGFDLCASVHCEVYKGVTGEHPRTTAAVKATRAEVATYNDEIINAVFSSNSGGYTESSLDVWSSELPYLTGVNNMLNNNLDFPLEPFELKQWLRESPPSYSKSKYSGDNTYRWTRIIPLEFFLDKYNIKELKNIIPLARSQGGSVKSIKIIGDNREINIQKDSIRSALGGLKSNRFFIEKVYDRNNKLKNIIIYGSGWGHNVGLDQTAAAGMVERGYDYKNIIYHFYPGTDIEKLY